MKANNSNPKPLSDLNVLDLSNFLAGSILVMAAVNERSRSGLGQFIDLAIYEVLGMNEVRDDPRFSDNRERIKNVDQLDAVIQKHVERFSLQQLLDLAQAKNSTFAPINSIFPAWGQPTFSLPLTLRRLG